MLLDLFTNLFRKDITKQSVWSGKELDALYAQVSANLLETLRVAKRVKPPKVNVEKYIRAQCYEEIREVVRGLLDGRKWHFVTFEDFTRALEDSSQTLLEVMKRRALRGDRPFEQVIFLGFHVGITPAGRCQKEAFRCEKTQSEFPGLVCTS